MSVMVHHVHEAMNDGQIPESLVNKASKYHPNPNCLRFSSMDHSFCREEDRHHNYTVQVFDQCVQLETLDKPADLQGQLGNLSHPCRSYQLPESNIDRMS